MIGILYYAVEELKVYRRDAKSPAINGTHYDWPTGCLIVQVSVTQPWFEYIFPSFIGSFHSAIRSSFLVIIYMLLLVRPILK